MKKISVTENSFMIDIFLKNYQMLVLLNFSVILFEIYIVILIFFLIDLIRIKLSSRKKEEIYFPKYRKCLLYLERSLLYFENLPTV